MFHTFDDELNLDDDQFVLDGLTVLTSPINEHDLVGTANKRSISPAVPIVERKLLRDSWTSFVDVSLSNRPTDLQKEVTRFDVDDVSAIDGDISNDSIKDLRARSVSPCKKRLFPGPAGLLQTKSPYLDDTYSRRSSKRGRWLSTPVECGIFKEGNISTQSTNNEVFEFDSWIMMRRDLAHIKGDNRTGPEILKTFNIANLLAEAMKNRLPCRKAPSLLCVILASIDYRRSGKFARAHCRDPTGDIFAWMDHDVVKECHSKLKPGCVLVLDKPSVFSVTRRKHYLGIHLCNIVYIYMASDCGTVERVEPSRSDKMLEITRVQSPSRISSNNNNNSSSSGSTSLTSGGSHSPPVRLRIVNVDINDVENQNTANRDSVVGTNVVFLPPCTDVTGASCTRRGSSINSTYEPARSERKLSSVVSRPRLSSTTSWQTAGALHVASMTNDSDKVATCNFQLEDDPLWNDDDFDSLLLRIGH